MRKKLKQHLGNLCHRTWKMHLSLLEADARRENPEPFKTIYSLPHYIVKASRSSNIGLKPKAVAVSIENLPMHFYIIHMLTKAGL